MKLEECPVELLGEIVSFLDFFEVSVILPAIGCPLLSRKLLLPRGCSEVSVKSDIWRKCPVQKWISLFLPFRHFSRLEISLPGHNVLSDPSWILNLPIIITHIAFEFDNAEHLWWQSLDPSTAGKWVSLLFSSRIDHFYGISPIPLRDIFPNLRTLHLISANKFGNPYQMLLNQLSPISPFSDPLDRPSNINFTPTMALKWIMELPPTITSLEAPELISYAWSALSSFNSHFGGSPSHEHWQRWQSRCSNGPTSEFNPIEAHTPPIIASDRIWNLPLPVSLTSIKSPKENIIAARSIAPSLAVRMQSLTMDWKDVEELIRFPSLLHLHMYGRNNAKQQDIVDLNLPKRLRSLTLNFLPPKPLLKKIFQNLPLTLQSIHIAQFERSECPEFTFIPETLTELHLGVSTEVDWSQFGPLIFPSQIRSLECGLATRCFDASFLPRSLTHLSLDLVSCKPWTAEYSKTLPITLTSLSYSALTMSDVLPDAFLELPDRVTRLSFPDTNEFPIERIECSFPKNVLELFLPSNESLSDVDLARLPRHWRAMSLKKLILTGKTLPNDMVGLLTIDHFSDSFSRLLPPKMPPFWEFRISKVHPRLKKCRIVTGPTGIELPRGITELDLLDFQVKYSPTSIGFSNLYQLSSLKTFKTEDFRPRMEVELPQSLTSFHSETPNSLATQVGDSLPHSLISLRYPSRVLLKLPFLPNLEFLEAVHLQGPSLIFPQVPKLNTLILRIINRSLDVSSLPDSLTSLQLHCAHLPKQFPIPANLRTLCLSQYRAPLTLVMTYPPTLTHLELRSIHADSGDIHPFLPSSLKTPFNYSFQPPHTGNDPCDKATVKSTSNLDPLEIESIRNRHSAQWLALTALSPKDTTPIIDIILRAVLPQLQHTKYLPEVTWELSHACFFPPALHTINIPLTNRSPLDGFTRVPIDPESATAGQNGRKFKVSFYSPAKGRVATSRAESLDVAVNNLLRPCYLQLPPNLTRFSVLSFDLPHWAPKYLPKALSVLQCSAVFFNTESYRQLPSSLTALQMTKMAKFFPKHALALPSGLKILDLQCHLLRDSTIPHLSRHLEVLDCSVALDLTIDSLQAMPPNLSVLLLPYHLEIHSLTPTKLPTSVRFLGGSRHDRSRNFLSLFLHTFGDDDPVFHKDN